MNAQKFISSWKKTREQGIILYVLKCMVLILGAITIGKIVGDYIVSGVILKTFSAGDYIGISFVCFVGAIVGLYLWNHNESRYKELIER